MRRFFLSVGLFLLVFSGLASAATLVRLEVIILEPGVKETISVDLNEEFSLNGIIRQKAVLSGYDQVYDNLIIQISGVKESGEVPEADLRISALKGGIPVNMEFSGMRTLNEEDCFGARIRLLDFVSNGENYVGARFVVEKPEGQKTMGEILVYLIRRFLFG